MRGTPYVRGKRAEELAVRSISKQGFDEVYLNPKTRGFYDVFADGLYIEVKHGRLRKEGWSANIHRAGKLNEDGVDAYVIVLDDIPGAHHRHTYLVLPAPIGKLLFVFDFFDLIGRYHSAINNFQLLREIRDQKRERQ